MAICLNANAVSANVSVTVRTDFHEKFDICIPEDDRVTLYLDLEPKVATAFMLQFLTTKNSALPQRCLAGHNFIASRVLNAQEVEPAELQKQQKAMRDYLKAKSASKQAE